MFLHFTDFFLQAFSTALVKSKKVCVVLWSPQVLFRKKLLIYSSTVEPRFNEVAGDRPNLFVKWRFRYIENLDITNLREKDQNVRYIEVIVNDWFATQVPWVPEVFLAEMAAEGCRHCKPRKKNLWHPGYNTGDFCERPTVPMSMTNNEPLAEKLLSLYDMD